jgi:hypothetical protein
MPFIITEVYAFIATGADGEEGIPAFLAPNGTMMPLVCADKARVQSLWAVAQTLARVSGKKIKLVRFHQMELLSADVLSSDKPPLGD